MGMRETVSQSETDLARELMGKHRLDSEIVAELGGRGIDAARANQILHALRANLASAPAPPAETQSTPATEVIRDAPSAGAGEAGGWPAPKLTERQLRVFGLVVVLTVAFGSSIFHSLLLLSRGITIADDGTKTVTWVSEFYGMIRQVGALGVLGYVLYRNSKSFRDIGLRWTARDAARGLPLLVIGYGLSRVLTPTMHWGAQMVTSHQERGPDINKVLFGDAIPMMTVGFMVVNGFFEELIVRAYLMTEIEALTRSTLLAIVCSLAVQTSYHFYQGAPNALSHLGLFLMFSLYYAKTRRALPIVLAHIGVDLTILVLHALRGAYSGAG